MTIDPVEQPDPRLVAFADWLEAARRFDWRACREATHRLRKLGISVCHTGSQGIASHDGAR